MKTSIRLVPPAILAILGASTPAAAMNAERGIDFEDVSSEIDFVRQSSSGLGGAAWFDYDNDERLDLFITNGEGRANGLFHNDGDGGFTDVAVQAGVAGYSGSSGVVTGDLDNDGCADLVLASAGGISFSTAPIRVYRNRCDGTFADVTASSGVTGPGTALSAALADIDGDGDLDLFLAAAGTFPGTPASYNEPSRLYLNNGDFTFTDITASSGIDAALGACSLTFSDYDNDNRIDLFVGNCNDVAFTPTPIQLFRNNGDLTFTERTHAAGIERGGFWMGLNTADYDHDGDLDLFATTAGVQFANPHALYRNDGDGTYTDVGVAAGVGDWEFSWGNAFADFDGNGDADIFLAGNIPTFGIVGNPGRFFLSDGAGSFTLHQTFGLEDAYASGIAAGDYDNDGFSDLAVVLSSVAGREGRPLLLHNEGNGNGWLTLRTVGTESNRDGVGARVEVLARGRRQVQEVRAGGSHGSSHAPWVTFGLGDAKAAVIDVRWPSGMVERFHAPRVNRRITVVEGTGAP